MSIIDTITAHYTGRGRQKIDVPEWGNGKGPLEIYFSPVTLEEKEIIRKAFDKSGVGSLAKAIVIKAEDKDGKKLFEPEDYYKLRKAADGDIVLRVGQAIINAPDVAEIEKNFEAT